ncbi:MAG: hypothetical protein QG629_52 [Patescibacteria group bacterium]|nr:hypothetical protein [Candidatus Saccharibacteria bacterium]MDQ5962970.1 hypothetical protein [Patescibacteria group bacterium]
MYRRNVDALAVNVNEIFALAESSLVHTRILDPVDCCDIRLYDATVDMRKLTYDGGINIDSIEDVDAVEASPAKSNTAIGELIEDIAIYQQCIVHHQNGGDHHQNGDDSLLNDTELLDTMQPDWYRISPEGENELHVELNPRGIVSAIRTWFDKSDDFSDPNNPPMGVITVRHGNIDIDGISCEYARDSKHDIQVVWSSESPFQGKLMELLNVVRINLEALTHANE